MKYYYRYCERGEGGGGRGGETIILFDRNRPPTRPPVVSAFPPKVRFRVEPLLIFAIFNRARPGIMIDSTIYFRPPLPSPFLSTIVSLVRTGTDIIGVHGWMKRCSLLG